jgi:2',3'-cyclic-nucleotide 2'-phosphodiesterase (5'-nucleotidase family)
MEGAVTNDVITTYQDVIKDNVDDKNTVIVALTHQLEENDFKLARITDPLTLILDGHVHKKLVTKIDKTHIDRSSEDFDELATVDIIFDDSGKIKEMVPFFTAMTDLTETDPTIYSFIRERMKILDDIDKVPLFEIDPTNDMDTHNIRLKQSSGARYLLDIVNSIMITDITPFSAGVIRSDASRVNYKRNNRYIFTYKDKCTMFPYMDELYVVNVPGSLHLWMCTKQMNLE